MNTVFSNTANYVFLDIDGVLNNTSTRTLTHDGWCFVDDFLVQRLQKLVHETNAIVILSSTWRDGWLKDSTDSDDNIIHNEPYFDELVNKLLEYNIVLTDKTGAFMYRRGWEIHEYLDKHPEIIHYVIIDDWDDMGDLKPHLVLTNPHYGLTDTDIEKAKQIIKQN